MGWNLGNKVIKGPLAFLHRRLGWRLRVNGSIDMLRQNDTTINTPINQNDQNGESDPTKTPLKRPDLLAETLMRKLIIFADTTGGSQNARYNDDGSDEED